MFEANSCTSGIIPQVNIVDISPLMGYTRSSNPGEIDPFVMFSICGAL